MAHEWAERCEAKVLRGRCTRCHQGGLVMIMFLAVAAASPDAAAPKPIDRKNLLVIIDSLLEEPLAEPRGAAVRATGAAPGLARSSSAGAHSGGPPQMDVPRRPEEHPVFGEWRGPKSDPPASPQGPKD